jgi:hypothetical protein
MARVLSTDARLELEVRRERLRLELRLCEAELRLVEAELRSDDALRLQDAARPEAERPRLSGGWRGWVR